MYTKVHNNYFHVKMHSPETIKIYTEFFSLWLRDNLLITFKSPYIWLYIWLLKELGGIARYSGVYSICVESLSTDATLHTIIPHLLAFLRRLNLFIFLFQWSLLHLPPGVYISIPESIFHRVIVTYSHYFKQKNFKVIDNKLV